MPELNKQEIQCPEMQEVMSEIPGSFLKWGIFIFFGIILILVIGSYLIKSPEIVTVKVVITTQNPPVSLVTLSGGEIIKLFISEGSKVTKDELVAVLNSTGKYDDVKNLNLYISGFNNKTDWVGVVKTMKLPPDLKLGEFQSNYTGFQKNWEQLGDYLYQAYIPAKLSILEKQIEKKIEYDAELLVQKKFQIEDLRLAKNSFERDSGLYQKDRNSISTSQFEKSKQAYIQKLYSSSLFNASLKNNEMDFLRLRESRLDLQIQYEKDLKQYLLNLEESLQLLRSSIAQWEEKYLIKTPIAGKVTLSRFRNDNQVIKSGELLATVIPDSITEIVVRAVIPASGFGLVEIGQPVNIKLSGFPYMKYGVLKGKICSLSQVPGEGGFSADIQLTGGMTSTYKEKIKFIHQMDGTADIITRDIRLINKFIDPLRNSLEN